MHPKDQIPDAQETDMTYHWNCPANTCTTKYIGETNRSLKERVSDHRNQTTSAIRNHHISTKHPKAENKNFTIIAKESNTYTVKQKKHFTFVSRIHYSTETLAKSESFSIQQTTQTSQTTRTSTILSPTQGGQLLYLVFQHKRQHFTPS